MTPGYYKLNNTYIKVDSSNNQDFKATTAIVISDWVGDIAELDNFLSHTIINQDHIVEMSLNDSRKFFQISEDAFYAYMAREVYRFSKSINENEAIMLPFKGTRERREVVAFYKNPLEFDDAIIKSALSKGYYSRFAYQDKQSYGYTTSASDLYNSATNTLTTIGSTGTLTIPSTGLYSSTIKLYNP